MQSPVDLSLTGADATLQRVALILATPLGMVPLDRGFGTDYEALDQPRPLAAARLRAAIVEAIHRDEPQVRVRAIRFESPTAGVLVPVVTVDILED